MKRVITASDGLSARDIKHIAETTTDPLQLQRLAHYTPSAEIRRAVALNRSTSQDILNYLADDEDVFVRNAVARRTDDPQLLAKFADDESSEVRWVAAKRTDDPQILAELADDKTAYVREVVAWRTDDPQILAKLADDPDADVREMVAKKTDDLQILAKLAHDEAVFVCNSAKERMKRLGLNIHNQSRSRKPTQTE